MKNIVEKDPANIFKQFLYLSSRHKLALLVSVFRLLDTRIAFAELVMPFVFIRYHWSIGQVSH